MWVIRIVNKRKQPMAVAKDNPDGPDFLPECEMFISYSEQAFCKASLLIPVLVKAVCNYWPHIDRKVRELCTKLPHARALFNTPYHTCAPTFSNHLVQMICDNV